MTAQSITTITDSRARLLAVMDKLGICASAACAIHCLLLPFVMAALPLLGLSFFASDSFEVGMIIGTITLAFLSFCWGCKIHGELRILFFALAAMMMFYIAHTYHDTLHYVFMAIGGLALTLGHLTNRKLCNTCSEPCCKG